ncbi:hypothetical protein HWV23_03580 [Natronomonas halophila]|uniref:DUF7504 family protein n=1 Tax=Natronomonas halophila TaxID=2747817 RepID=UPI0015B59A14|nr:hypothetical protein [Natronomonas halophila]QLD84833.1 hypothetical protein HWV23_03580 [Natronomonas halophila]
MSTMRSRCDDPALAVDPPANVLLEAPSLSEGGMSICPHIKAETDAERNLLFVSLSGNPDSRLDMWRRHGGLPGKVAIITADNTRSVAASGGGSTTRQSGETVISTTTVSEPSDLTGIGIKMNNCLSAWEDDDARTHVCFDSLTTLLQYVDTERVFQYLHVTTKRIEAVDGVAHYHIDPNAHDDQTLATIESLFSDVCRYDTETDDWVEA